MKIAFCMSKHFFEIGGGGRVQVLKTKEYLEKFDASIKIVILHDYNLINSSFDICHVFNMAEVDVTLAFIFAAKKFRIKTFLSTIYWDYNYLVMTGMFSKIFGFNYTETMYRLERSLGKISALFTGRPEYFTNTHKKKIRKNC